MIGMRVAYLTCVYPPYPGGIGVLAQGMAKEMGKRGYEVEVFAPFHPFRPWFHCGNAAFIPQLIWKLKDFDVIHLLYPFFGVAELIGLIKKKTKAKIVVHHTMDAIAPGLKGLLFKLHQKIFLKRIFIQGDAVIALSEDYFINCSIASLGLSVEFIPNGVDTDLFVPASVEKDVPIVLFVGGLDKAHYFKGVDVLLKAMKIIKDDCVCKIIGDGNLRPKYEKLAGSNIEFLGLIDHEKLPLYYQKAAVVVVPSTERIECFSITAAEAQACGIPTVVSDFPGVRTTIEHGVTGYVVEPNNPQELADRIQKLIADSEKAQTMGQAARKRATELYSWKTIGDKLEKIYEGLCN